MEQIHTLSKPELVGLVLELQDENEKLKNQLIIRK